MKTAICILHYGDPSLAARLRDQIVLAEKGANEHVFVLDNAAPLPFEGAWKRLPENIYWVGAFELALREFEELGYTHLWFFNNDALFISSGPYISKTVKRFLRMEEMLGKIGIYSPSVPVNPYHAQMCTNAASQCKVVPYVDGIAPLVSINCVKELGGLDAGSNIYGYGVDVWLGLRASRAGWKVVVDNHVVVRHTYHHTAKKIDGFLQKAATLEAEFLTSRLGPDYKTVIEEQQKECVEIMTLKGPTAPPKDLTE